MKELDTVEFEHHLLGRLTGIRRNNLVVQYRGIPYGRIPARFRQAVAIETLQPKDSHCAEYGPACPQIPQSPEAFGGLPAGAGERWYNEFSCLNLTVTAPLPSGGERPNCSSKLPVMVYVHGGGFAEGAHYGMVHGTWPVWTASQTTTSHLSNRIFV
jgi:carboxylesterase type B